MHCKCKAQVKVVSNNTARIIANNIQNTHPYIPTKTSDLINDSGFITNEVNDLEYYTKTSDLGGLAFENSVDYDTQVTNKPTIPEVNDGTLTIQKNGTTIAIFSANQSSNITANILADEQVQSDWNQNNSSSPDYIKNKPNIPVVNNSTITIQKNGTTVESFTTNQSENETINISVPTQTSDLTNNSGFITNAVNDLTNYYLKSETYTQNEVNSLLAAIKTIKAEIVAELPTASVDTYFNTSKTIYLVSNSGSGNDYYDEYITVRSGVEGSYIYSWEKIGNTQIDLSDYVKKTDYATGSTAGVVKISNGAGISQTGAIYANNYSASTYQLLGLNEFIGKGTLEAIKSNYVKDGVTANTNTLNSTEKTAAQTWLGLSSLSASSSGTDVSLVTTGEKYDWNNKQNALPTISTAGKVLKSTSTAGIVEWGDDMPTNYVSSVNGDTGEILNVAKTNTSNTFTQNQQFDGLVYLEGSTPFVMSKTGKIGLRATNAQNQNLGQINISNAWYGNGNRYGIQLSAFDGTENKYNQIRVSHNGPEYIVYDNANSTEISKTIATTDQIPTIPTTSTAGQLVKSTSTSGTFALGNGLPYLTTTPTADNTDGLILVKLSSEPATKYNGYIYIITSS